MVDGGERWKEGLPSEELTGATNAALELAITAQREANMAILYARAMLNKGDKQKQHVRSTYTTYAQCNAHVSGGSYAQHKARAREGDTCVTPTARMDDPRPPPPTPPLQVPAADLAAGLAAEQSLRLTRMAGEMLGRARQAEERQEASKRGRLEKDTSTETKAYKIRKMALPTTAARRLEESFKETGNAPRLTVAALEPYGIKMTMELFEEAVLAMATQQAGKAAHAHMHTYECVGSAYIDKRIRMCAREDGQWRKAECVGTCLGSVATRRRMHPRAQAGATADEAKQQWGELLGRRGADGGVFGECQVTGGTVGICMTHAWRDTGRSAPHVCRIQVTFGVMREAGGEGSGMLSPVTYVNAPEKVAQLLKGHKLRLNAWDANADAEDAYLILQACTYRHELRHGAVRRYRSEGGVRGRRTQVYTRWYRVRERVHVHARMHVLDTLVYMDQGTDEIDRQLGATAGVSKNSVPVSKVKNAGSGSSRGGECECGSRAATPTCSPATTPTPTPSPGTTHTCS